MPNPPANTSADSLVKAVRAILRHSENSYRLLNNSQLSAIQFELRGSLAKINDKIAENERAISGDQKFVINMNDDYEDGEGPSNADQEMETGDELDDPLEIPDPYPLTPPPEMEDAEIYYVVSVGRQVGIFINNVLSTHAVRGIPGGHQLGEKTWHRAAVLYNSLWEAGLIKRVRA